MKKKAAFGLILFFSFLARIYSQDQPNLVFERLSIEHGLSQSTINCILKDSRGFLWFGTKDGLNRYDGYTFKIYKSDPSRAGNLVDNLIQCLIEDSDGNLWIGTQGGGLNRFDRRSERFEAYDPGVSLSGARTAADIRALCLAADGNIWTGTLSGLFLFDRATKNFKSFRHDPHDAQSLSGDRIFCLYRDSRGDLWIGFEGEGFNRFNPRTEKAERFSIEPLSGDPDASENVDAIFEDASGILWIGSPRGLIRFDPRTRAMTIYRNNPADPASLRNSAVRSICSDSQGMMWLAMLDQGLEYFDPKTGRCLHFRYRPNDPRYLSYDSLNCLLLDSSGILWIGTNGASIIKVNPPNRNFRVFSQIESDPDGIHMKSIRCISEDADGSLLIGGYNSLDRLGLDQKRFIQLINNESVYCVLPDSGIPGTILIGLEGTGLKAFNKRKKTMTPFPPPQGIPGAVLSLRKDRRGRLWIGTGLGLRRYDLRTGNLTAYESKPADKNSLSHNVVKVIYEDRNGTMWIGTDGGGLNVLDENAGMFRHFIHDPLNPKSISHNRISCVMEDSQGRMWIGTQGGGLNLFQPQTGTFTWFREKDGLPNDVVYGILEDSQYRLWLSTNKGISRFDIDSKTFKNFDKNDGLPSDEFNGGAYFKTSRGEIAFGGINGLILFKPEEIRDFTFVPPVVVTDFQIFNKPVPIDDDPKSESPLRSSVTETRELTLSYRDRVFTFEFAALNYIFPGKNQYAYKMEGFEKEWNYVGTRRYAHYTNLSPGRYTFRVKGSNNDGVWNEEGASIRIRITPPFWKTPWFLTLCGLTIVFMTLGAFNRRVRQLTKKKKELEALVALRTQELKEASLKDPLTGLRNRRFISEVLVNDLQAFIAYKTYLLEHNSNRRKLPENTVFGIFLIDIDHFKDINDEYGHDAGDQFLVQFADILKSSVRGDDVIVRFGGEEFLVILKNCDPEYLQPFSWKIKNRIAAADFAVSNQILKKTCSLGVIQYPFYHSQPKLIGFERSLILVDQGLYHAKKNGRNMAVHILPGRSLPDEAGIAPLSQNLEFGIRRGFLSLNEIR